MSLRDAAHALPIAAFGGLPSGARGAAVSAQAAVGGRGGGVGAASVRGRGGESVRDGAGESVLRLREYGRLSAQSAGRRVPLSALQGAALGKRAVGGRERRGGAERRKQTIAEQRNKGNKEINEKRNKQMETNIEQRNKEQK